MELEEEKENIEKHRDFHNKRTLNNYVKKNPVLIKPAVEADKIKNILKENVKQNKKVRERFKNVFNMVKDIDKHITEKQIMKKQKSIKKRK